jgi:hypothetical protein
MRNSVAALQLAAEPRRLHCRRFAAKHKGFLADVVNRAAFNRFPQRGKEKGALMKFATVSKSFVLVAALLLASSAFAATKHTLQISTPVTVNGQTLKAGDYKVQWEGTGPNVELSILQGKNVVAKAPAHIVDLPSPSSSDAAVVRRNDSGTSSLTAIRFQGKKMSLELGDTSEAMQSGSSQ